MSAEHPFVALARRSIALCVSKGTHASAPEPLPVEMERRAGVFVSLHLGGALRGCIGTIEATRENLALEIIHNAISASTRDPRFSPVTGGELDALDISVDVLGEAERVADWSELDPKRYGVIVSSGRRRGLLLPDLDGVDTVEQQVSIALRKAWIDESEPYMLERFEVVRYH